MVRLGSLTSFSEASEVLAELLGVKVTPETIRRVTEAAGRGLVEHETREAVELTKTLAQPAVQVVDRLQQVSVDGAMVPLVHGEWAEVKTVVIGRVVQAGPEPRAEGLTYFSRLSDHLTFSDQANIEFWRRGTEKAREVVAVTDGAEWIQGFVEDHCPNAVRIIDWTHAVSYLNVAGQALFGPGTADCTAWVAVQKQTLWTDRPEPVIAALTELEASSGLEPVRIARQYLEKRLDQLRYAAFRAAALPVGSGIVESANKAVVEMRLKGRGRHWERTNVDSMLSLRCASASRAWSGRWHLAESSLRRSHRHRPPPPQPTAPPPALEPPITSSYVPTIVGGRPTKDHPWKTHPAAHPKT
jgi:hypothetical protein